MGNSSGLLKNLTWKFSERILSQLIGLVLGVILARILSPQDYGLVAMVTVFTSLSYVLVDGGFCDALIQKKDADALDFSTVFYFSVSVALVLYLMLYFCAPMIANFYGEGYKELTPIIRVLGVQIIIYSMNAVQHAYVAKHMMFKKFFVSTLWGTVLSGVLGLYMALTGFGVWALVWQGLVSSFIGLISLYYSTRKLPLLAFSFRRLRELFKFGANILAGSLLIKVYVEMRSLIIGKLYSAQDLAFYTKGRAYPNLIVANINTSIGAVLFPRISQEQKDLSRVKEITRNSIRFSSYLMMPLMFGLAVVGEPFIRLLLTEKWVPCVPLMQWFCIVYLFQPIHTANMQAIKALGRSDIYLKLELIKKTIELITLVAVMWISVDAIVINMAVMTVLFTFINAYPNKRLINYSYKEQYNDIAQSLYLSIAMVVSMCIVGYFVKGDVLLLFFQLLAGIVIYILMSSITKNKEYNYIAGIVKDKLKWNTLKRK